jgi:hypothetical protein
MWIPGGTTFDGICAVAVGEGSGKLEVALYAHDPYQCVPGELMGILGTLNESGTDTLTIDPFTVHRSGMYWLAYRAHTEIYNFSPVLNSMGLCTAMNTGNLRYQGSGFQVAGQASMPSSWPTTGVTMVGAQGIVLLRVREAPEEFLASDEHSAMRCLSMINLWMADIFGFQINAAAITYNTLTNDRIFCEPFVVCGPSHLQYIAGFISVGDVGEDVTLGLYNSRNNYPHQLMASKTITMAGGAETVSIILAKPLPPGLYWLAWRNESSASPTMTNAAEQGVCMFALDGYQDKYPAGGLRVNYVAAAGLPDPFTGTSPITYRPSFLSITPTTALPRTEVGVHLIHQRGRAYANPYHVYHRGWWVGGFLTQNAIDSNLKHTMGNSSTVYSPMDVPRPVWVSEIRYRIAEVDSGGQCHLQPAIYTSHPLTKLPHKLMRTGSLYAGGATGEQATAWSPPLYLPPDLYWVALGRSGDGVNACSCEGGYHQAAGSSVAEQANRFGCATEGSFLPATASPGPSQTAPTVMLKVAGYGQ